MRRTTTRRSTASSNTNGRDKVRAFVAVELPESVRRGLAGEIHRLEEMVEQDTVRFVRSEGIHLTLKFLGEVPAGKVDAVGRALDQAAAQVGPFEATAGGFGAFPNATRPRVLWVGVGDPSGSLSRLQSTVERTLAPLGFKAEPRPFHPHLTLGRVRRESSRSDERALGSSLEGHEIAELGRWQVRECALMKSDLRPQGAVYSRVAAFTLVGSA